MRYVSVYVAVCYGTSVLWQTLYQEGWTRGRGEPRQVQGTFFWLIGPGYADQTLGGGGGCLTGGAGG